jgi:hypothetical protein
MPAVASRDDAGAYARFWAAVGERFPDLAGAVSTDYYAVSERRLFAEHFPPLRGLRILKTDLWDEAKNTRILVWASRHGLEKSYSRRALRVMLEAAGLDVVSETGNLFIPGWLRMRRCEAFAVMTSARTAETGDAQNCQRNCTRLLRGIRVAATMADLPAYSA